MVRKIVCCAVVCASLFSGSPLLQAQDLSIALANCPKTAKAGQDLRSVLQLLAANTGDKTEKNIVLEIVLKSSPLCPKTGRPAAYSPRYYDGVLLRQGHELITLEPGKSLTISPYGANTIPWDTPVGRTYYLCAVIDPGNVLKETSKDNNCACCPIKVIGTETEPQITRLVESCLVPGSTLTILGNNFGAEPGTVSALSTDGSAIKLSVSSWNESMIIARVPNDARMQEGRQYTITVTNRGGQAGKFSGGKNIAICPVKENIPGSGTIRPELPLFFDQQQ